jgi:predicted RNA-binding Zn ribbon-like protein
VSARAGSLPLVGGELCLDFCNTASGRGSPEAADHLGSHADVLRWAVHAGVLSRDAAGRIARALGETEGARLLRRALAAREAIHGVLAPVAAGARPDPGRLRAFNALVARAYAGAEVAEGDDGRLVWRYPAPESRPDGLLAPLVRSAAALATGRDPARLKACPGRGCGWLFYDTTKNASRVWCEMRVCGNRAKARARYRRLRRGPFRSDNL